MNSSITSKLLRNLFVCSVLLVGCISPLVSQNQVVYQSLYTNTNFIKNIDQNRPVGVVEGHGAAASGSATYSVPLRLPPGTHGVVPELAMVYQSGNGTGLLGYGWALQGMSAITRTRATIVTDGDIQPIDGDASDQFALDGVRLILLNGTQGAAGSVYEKEQTDFCTITAFGNTGSGPLYFECISKDGKKFEYGKSNDSRFLHQNGSTVMVWRLNKISYPDGNYIQYYYTGADRDHRISEIWYTGNTNTGLMPYNKVQFNYGIRTDITTTYEAGAWTQSRYLLQSIQVYAEQQLTRVYTLNYATNQNIHSYLREIVESGSDGSALNSTIFKYGDLPVAFSTASSTSLVQQSTDIYFSGDWDADGLADLFTVSRVQDVNDPNIFYATNFKVFLKLNASNTQFTEVLSVPLPSGYTAFDLYNGPNNVQSIIDFNGDSASDLIFLKTTGSGNNRWLQEINFFVSQYISPQSNTYQTFAATPFPGFAQNNKIHPSGNFYLLGDFNGDGRSDVFTFLGNNSNAYSARIYPGGSGGWWNEVQVNGPSYFPEWQWGEADSWHVVDFNGDGKDDLMLIKEAQCEVYTFNGNGQAVQIYQSGFPTKWHLPFFGDFNGDGKTDVLVRTSIHSNNAPWYLALGTGKGYVETSFVFQKLPSINSAYYGDRLLVGDYNEDGKSDICHIWNVWTSQTTLQSNSDLYYSKGNQFVHRRHLYSKSITSAPLQFLMDANGDGRQDVMVRGSWNAPFDLLFFNKNGKEPLLHGVKNGFDHDVQWTYLRPSNGTGYTRGSINTYPLNNLQTSIPLVSEFRVEDGVGGFYTKTFEYHGLKYHKLGRGFMGFLKIIESDPQTQVKEVLESGFDALLYFPTWQSSKKIHIGSNSLLSETHITRTIVPTRTFGKPAYWTKVNSIHSDFIFENRYKHQEFTYDAFGNVLQSNSDNNGIEAQSEVRTYVSPVGSIPHRPSQVIASKTRLGQAVHTVQMNYSYNALGQVIQKVDFTNTPKALTTNFVYDQYGNTTQVGLQTANAPTRNSSMSYDPKGRFVIQTTNALGQVSTQAFDVRWGSPTVTTGMDGLSVQFQYDAFGRLKSSTAPSGVITTETYGWSINPAEDIVQYHLSAHPGKPDKYFFKDLIARERKIQVEGFRNNPAVPDWITTLISYDQFGNKLTVTAPFKNGETPLITTYHYDSWQRLTGMSNALGTTTQSYDYTSDGKLLKSVTPASGASRVEHYDATGKLVELICDQKSLSYTYDAQEQLIRVKNGRQTLMESTYDVYGNQVSLTEPNSGTYTYTYDGFQQMLSQITPSGQTFSFQYDLLGRVIQESVPEGSSVYEYYQGGSAGNQLKKITGFSGDVQNFIYDPLGRIKSHESVIDGISASTAYNYDAYGNVVSTIYGSGLQVYSEFDQNGFLKQVKHGSQQQLIYERKRVNGYQLTTQSQNGHGVSTQKVYQHALPISTYTPGIHHWSYQWDYSSGNLTSRSNVIKGKSEQFTYDAFNQLTGVSSAGLPGTQVQYAFNGNIQSKSQLGNYTYDGSRMHAVSSIENPGMWLPSSTLDISYTSFHQPLQIAESGKTLVYTYGAEQQRIKSVYRVNGTIQQTRYYFTGFERFIDASGTSDVHYLENEDGLFAIIVRKNGVDQLYYAYTDHLGSIVQLTDVAGNIVAEQSFDAWGKRRHPGNWSYNNIPTIPAWLSRGFTGHEHIEPFGLVNMNGRLYDPVLGRMLSVDNQIQSLVSVHGFNRYTYASNNPLRYTDPDGEFGVKLLFHLLAPIVNLLDGKYENDPAQFVLELGLSIFNGLVAEFNPLDFSLGPFVQLGISVRASSSTDGIGLGLEAGFSVGKGKWSFLELYGGVRFVASSPGTNRTNIESYGGWGAGVVRGDRSVSPKDRLSLGVMIRSTRFFSGETTQTVGSINIYFPVKGKQAYVQYENDWMFHFPIADGGDRFRTTGVRLAYGDYWTQLNMFTGDPGLKEREVYRNSRDIKTYEEISEQYRFAAISFGSSSARLGINSEGVRNLFQNKIAHGNGKAHPIFEVLRLPVKMYSFGGNFSPYTSW